MIESIVYSSDPVTLVGGGSATEADLLNSLSFAPLCVAADGGAALAQLAGVPVEAVIGDFDSIAPEILAQIPPNRQHHVPEQVTTDFEKALSRIAAPLVIGVGFLGGRLDHQLAAFHGLRALAHLPCVLLGETEVVFLVPPLIELPMEAGDVVSLFPLAPVRGRSRGLHWPLDGLDFAPGQMIGTSNRATGPVRIEMDAPGMLAILPRRLMPEVVAQLRQRQAGRWPAP